MRGYHFYLQTDFRREKGFTTPDKSVVVHTPEKPVDGPFSAVYSVDYYQERSDEIRVWEDDGYAFPSRYERLSHGAIWVAPGVAILEINEPPVHQVADQLNKMNKVDLTRVVFPTLKDIDSKLENKTGRGIEDPLNQNRRRMQHFGADVAKDKTNTAELKRGRLKFIQFGPDLKTARVMAGGGLLLYGAYSDESGAAKALEIWDSHLKGIAKKYTPDWWKQIK